MLSGIFSSAPAALRRSAFVLGRVLAAPLRAFAMTGRAASMPVRMLAVAAATGVLASGCGFNLPNQAPLDETIPEIVVTGDYNSDFYRKVILRLKANGVRVHAQSSDHEPENNGTIPSLMIPHPDISDNVVSVNSRAQAIENAIVIYVAATLSVPNHRPIVMRNSITRSVLNKPGQSLAADTEKSTVIEETLSQLADDLVFRLGYLGRSTDPDVAVPQPYELLSSDEESIDPGERSTGMTLIEALQAQDSYESANGTVVTLDQLDNGNALLRRTPATAAPVGAPLPGDPGEHVRKARKWELPDVRPERLHKAPVAPY